MAAASPAALSSAGMTTPLRIVIAGAGYIASVHARCLRAHPDAAIVGICDIEPGKAEAFIAQHAPGAAAFRDFAAMLDGCRPDTVYLALPPFANAGQAELAAARGLHLFLEKPIALNAAGARSIADAVRRAGVVSQVGHHMRFGAAVQRLRAALADGSAGRVTLFQAAYRCNSLHGPWWRDRSRSGGQVFEQVIHLYDLARLLCGEAVQAWGLQANLCHAQVPGYTVEDTSVGGVRFTSGALAAITGSNCAVPMEWSNPFSVVCERLTATFADANHAEFAWTGAEPVRRETVAGDTDMYAAETAEFLAAIRAGGRTTTPAEEGARSVALVEAVCASAAAGGIPRNLGA